MAKRIWRNCMLVSTTLFLTSAQHSSAQYAADYRTSPAANSSTMASLEQDLNAIDTQSGWSRTPVSGYSQTQLVPPRRPRSPAPGTAFNQVQGMFPGVSRQEMMRVFFEGGSPQMGGSVNGAPAPARQASSSANTSSAYSNYQTARNEEQKAHNNANKARYDKDDANQAEYAANNAEYSAQRAESAAYSGDSQARSYARLARESANRARYYANQARYNANIN